MEQFRKIGILFVCLGNICRSPAAEGVMRSIIEREGCSEWFDVDSAGTYGGHAGELPDPRMRSAASRRGYNLTHRSRKIQEEDFERFDMIVVMDDMNYENVHRLAPSRKVAEKIFRMTEFCRKFPERSYVPDPYYEGHEGFELVLDMLEDGCEEVFNELKNQFRS
ncbi:MAG: low molecular weight phosphotyrosine protein phosphatase [Rikenellaceae bacterium]|nr:low molecular weight phosphotyrosine protein phosphatase [Rikenellaceae bacterium]